MIDETRDIPIEDLHLHLRNPRCLFTSTEKEALRELLVDQTGRRGANKLLSLARDIADHGLSPTDLVMVKPAEGGFTVREGNRRVAAIKCSIDPGIIPDEFARLRESFSNLSNSVPRIITCHVTDDEDEINRIIGLKHGGQGGGIGTIPWDATQKARFEEILSGIPDKTVRFSDSLVKRFGIDSTTALYLSKCQKTNLERMLGNPHVRETIGVRLSDSTYVYEGERDRLLEAFLKKLSTTKVSDIYYAEDRERFVDELVEVVTGVNRPEREQPRLPEPYSAPTLETKEIYRPVEVVDTALDEQKHYDVRIDADEKPRGGTVNEGEKPRRTPSYELGRKRVIPRTHNLNTRDDPRIKQVHRELRDIDPEAFPTAAALLLRTLIQICADSHLEANGFRPAEFSSFANKIDKSTEILQKKGLMQRSDLASIRQIAHNNSFSAAVTLQMLDGAAHASSWIAPSASDLVRTWDGIYKVLEKMMEDRPASS